MYRWPAPRRLPSATLSDTTQPLGWCPPCSMDDVPHAAWVSSDPGYTAVPGSTLPPRRPPVAGRAVGMQQCPGHPDTAFQLLPVMLGERTWLFQVAAGRRSRPRARLGGVGTFTVSLLAVAMLGAFCWC